MRVDKDPPQLSVQTGAEITFAAPPLPFTFPFAFLYWKSTNMRLDQKPPQSAADPHKIAFPDQTLPLTFSFLYLYQKYATHRLWSAIILYTLPNSVADVQMEDDLAAV